MPSHERRGLTPIQTLEPMLLMSASSVELPVDVVTIDGEYNVGENSIESFSPIAIDLNDDGKIGTTGETTAQDKSGITGVGPTVEFDIDGDGSLDHIEWFDGSGDGILVDQTKIANTKIDGEALFGDEGGEYAHGYEKLAELDRDGNQLLEGSELAHLRLWLDDGDAKLESGELQKLSDHDIYALSVRLYQEDGLFRSWAYTDKETQIMTEDVWFAGTDQPDDQNRPPIAVDDLTVTESGKPVTISVLNNDSDPDGQAISVIGHTQAEHGTITLNANKTLTYTPPIDFTGVVYVQYSISDGTDAAIATVRIDVMPRTDAAPNIVAPDPAPSGVTTTTGSPIPDSYDFDFDDDDDDSSEKSDNSDKSNSDKSKSEKSEKSDKSDKSTSEKSGKSESEKSDKSKSEKSDKSG